MPNKELQELLSARFDGHTHTTNASVWNGIESQLDANKTDPAGFWFWIFNGIAATLLVGLLIQSAIINNSVSSLSQSQIAKEAVQEEIKVEQVPAQVDEPVNDQTNASISVITKVENGPNSTELSVGFVEKKTAKSATEKIPSVGNNEKNRNLRLAESKVLNKKNIDQEITQQLAYLDIFPTNSRSCPEKLVSNSPVLLHQQKGSFLKNLPIHLGIDFSYLRHTRIGDEWFIPIDSNYSFANYPLEKNRHFEFSVFSQFDLSKRFSATIGLGYSGSKFVNTSWGISASNDPLTDITMSNQRILIVPVQAKFAFLQKNRVTLSAGLNFQVELGRILSTYADQQLGASNSGGTTYSEMSTIEIKKGIQQFAVEPFLQFSVALYPRISTFANLGYRRYFGQTITGSNLPTKLNYLNTDIGVIFRIH